MSDELFEKEMEKGRQKLEKVIEKKPSGQRKGTERYPAYASRTERRDHGRTKEQSKIPLINVLVVFFMLVPVAVYFCYTYLFHR
ncbi:hypothetical protein BpJC7_06160 [Weizmannia acidilactici]|uniref:Uncharacterized protein n=1 Tax=Weizmannia acidilactici TaxID=2607726 RepID=A0A5J4JBM6_9BACI|nr:hypothetical protein [Weizmannia acidilactici]GER66052.1 hypothetical protein BpJC4_05230 [Weizmannia acidilactici]GER69313.1 hypothetical protein BpJC7_06160 [Weizmannia acidilactici]GER72361.1 hypothetical protein BpPP18_04280 [Weizmannia acidilactici]